MKNIMFRELINSQNFGYSDELKIKNTREKFNCIDKLLNSNVKLYIYRIEYTYVTKRGNPRENFKILVLNSLDVVEAKKVFLEEMLTENRRREYRAISDILIRKVSYEEIKIELK